MTVDVVGAPTRNGGAAVVETLEAHGVRTVFGIPGTHNLEIYRHFAASSIQAVTTRHEQGAGYGADGYAQVARRPGVVVTTTGPGTLNAATAVATSYAESRPVLLISSGLPRAANDRDLGELHDTKDVLGAMACLTAWSVRPQTPEEVVDAIAQAFTLFVTERPRPVYIEVPLDVLEAEWRGTVGNPVQYASRIHANDEELARAAAMLQRSQRPAMVLGGGSVDAAPEVRDLAERLNAIVVTTCNGKGVVPETHPLSAGASVRLRGIQRYLDDSDALMVVGSELSDADLWDARLQSKNVIRVDIDHRQLQKGVSAAVPLLGDARSVVGELSKRVDARPFDEHAASVAAALRASATEEALVDGAEWRELNSALHEALPSDAIVAGDSSQVTYLGTIHFYAAQHPASVLYMPRSATLGYALPAAIGAKLAAPDRPVVALLGDGALMFSIQELVTAVEQRLTIPIVVVNNGGYAEIKQQEKQRGIDPIGVDLFVPDLAELATAMGAVGVTARDAAHAAQLAAAALDAAGPTLIQLQL
ncbi:MAG TPA: thiamine pyrophosphate-binding protein [Nocardioidaceae bacterium]|nr:thiamine pyrophosphate-binding protein [Nocardioidaceae bacterium]